MFTFFRLVNHETLPSKLEEKWSQDIALLTQRFWHFQPWDHEKAEERHEASCYLPTSPSWIGWIIAILRPYMWAWYAQPLLGKRGRAWDNHCCSSPPTFFPPVRSRYTKLLCLYRIREGIGLLRNLMYASLPYILCKLEHVTSRSQSRHFNIWSEEHPLPPSKDSSQKKCVKLFMEKQL